MIQTSFTSPSPSQPSAPTIPSLPQSNNSISRTNRPASAIEIKEPSLSPSIQFKPRRDSNVPHKERNLVQVEGTRIVTANSASGKMRADGGFEMGRKKGIRTPISGSESVGSYTLKENTGQYVVEENASEVGAHDIGSEN